MNREKQLAFVLGVVGLAGALTMAAFAAPNRGTPVSTTRVPSDPGEVLAKVPPPDEDERAMREALIRAPGNLEAAMLLAHAEIDRARRDEDPRHLGRAQAVLGPWWNLANPPPDILLLRATIAQSLHDFASARADLERLLLAHPDDEQALLTHAVVATVTGDYKAAEASCGRLRTPLLSATCQAPIDAVSGRAAACPQA